MFAARRGRLPLLLNQGLVSSGCTRGSLFNCRLLRHLNQPVGRSCIIELILI